MSNRYCKNKSLSQCRCRLIFNYGITINTNLVKNKHLSYFKNINTRTTLFKKFDLEYILIRTNLHTISIQIQLSLHDAFLVKLNTMLNSNESK